ncbi:phosphotransferase family protein [Streptomyces sp. H27-D2]|uniref:phosphotransferase family protein n=1 Tax=Streptomyces sp. H27-D2 TaxID=3046304 RepID=UPI002DB68491|nr:phosphotransferase [Streptomyces sp. H27-D2]MEC4019440.1 phosphotransferase [Streptomyces sp. H27-D2]
MAAMLSHGPVSLNDATRDWLRREVLGGRTPAGARTLLGGYTNESILLTTDARDRYVLRRYRPSDSQVPRNTCAVEAAVLRRLTGTVPVPDVVAADETGDATGGPLLVYRFVDGTLLGDLLPGLDHREAAPLGRAVGGVLARIGSVRLPRPGPFRGPALAPEADSASAVADLPGFIQHCLEAPGCTRLLTDADRKALRSLAAQAAHWIAGVVGASSLVHRDFNPKNVLVTRRRGRWEVAAVLDWEQAFSGPALLDVGNMLRFAHEYPAAFVQAFLEGVQEDAGPLPDDWPVISHALDLFALADILTHPPDTAFFERTRGVLYRRLDQGLGGGFGTPATPGD